MKGGQGKGGWVGGGAEMQELVSRPLSWIIRKCAVVPREAGEVYTKKIGSVYRSVYCTYIYILQCYTTLSSINTSRFYTLLPLL